jgi:hypothetical protein
MNIEPKTSKSGALSHIRVLDLSRVLAGSSLRIRPLLSLEEPTDIRYIAQLVKDHGLHSIWLIWVPM